MTEYIIRPESGPTNVPLLTIGDRFYGHPDVRNISDGEFRASWLKDYPDTTPLLDCCLLAVMELAERPYLGRKSNAQVMGLAMQLLRERHSVNAPHNWLPAMKRLRGQSSVGSSEPRTIT